MVNPPAKFGATQVFSPRDPDYAARVRATFARQGAMRLIGAVLRDVGPGVCSIELPYRDDLTQHDRFVHAGIVSAIVDTAGGFAGFTLFPPNSNVLTVEYKLNMLAPARGERLIARGEVARRDERWSSHAARCTARLRANACCAPSCSRR